MKGLETIKWIASISYYWLLFWACLICLIIGIARYFKLIRLIKGMMARRELIDFVENKVNSAIIVGDIGRGKTLLMSIIASGIKHGVKKMGFVNNIRDAEMLSYNDINIHEPKYLRDTYNIPKFFFLDEGNLYIDGVDFRTNRKIHKGVELFLTWSRHFGVRFWMTAQREGQAWIAMRSVVNYFVRIETREKLWDWQGRERWIMPVKFYSQSGVLTNEFDIAVSDLDFALYDSYWLSGIRWFLKTQKEPEHNRWIIK